MPHRIKKGDYFWAIETQPPFEGRKIGPFECKKVTAKTVQTEECIFELTAWTCEKGK